MSVALPEPPVLLDQSEATLKTLISEVEAPRRPGPGRPQVLPAMVLWVGLTVCVLRGFDRQLDLWRLLTGRGLWHWQRLEISDEAVYRRLAASDASRLAEVFAQLTEQLIERSAPWAEQHLAPFAAEVVARAETRLDPVARSLPALRQVAVGDHALLPGTIAGVYDVRRQLWRTIQPRYGPQQNERVAAPDLVAELPAGELVLADLGYFSFPWFDDLTDAGHYWISRMRNQTS